jgi:hypothetical protein
MTLTIFDPRTGSRIAITVPEKREAKQRARLRIIRELDRCQPQQSSMNKTT